MIKKIIAVEDSPNLQKILKLIFSETEFQFELCENYEQLAQNYKMINYDLLLLDFSISSNIDGYSLCRNIKRDHPKLKIILMFGTFDSPDKDKLVYSGADEHIYKPFDSEKLLKLCQKMTKENALNSNSNSNSSKSHSKVNLLETTVPEIMMSDFASTNDAHNWGSIDVPSIIGADGMMRTTLSVANDIDDHQSEYHMNAENSFLDKTEVIDLDSKRKNDHQNIQKIQQIIGKEKIEDLWTFDGQPQERAQGGSGQSQKMDKERYFENVDREVLKRELMTEFKRTLIFEVKDEVMKDLFKFVKQEMIDKKQDMIDRVLKEVVKEIKASVDENEIKNSIISSVENKISKIVKDEIPSVLHESIDTLASRAAQAMLEKKMSTLIPDLAEDLIKKDLAAIRKHVM